MARVVLHVGMHKTGSTSLQNAFAANRKLLGRHGVIYPEVTRADPAHHGLAAKWNPNLAQYEPPGGSEAAWHALARRYRASDSILFLSSEEFCRDFGVGAVDYDWIREALSGFERVDVICVLRDQISFLQSAYLQVLRVSRADKRDRPVASWTTFLGRALKTGRATALTLDYNVLLDRLEAAFGAGHISALSYAEAAGRAGGSVDLVLEELGRPTDLVRRMKLAEQANVTGDPLSVWAAGQVTAPLRPNADLIALVRGVVADRFGEATTLYSAAEAEAVRRRFEEANERLVDRVRDRRPGFSLPWMSVDDAAQRDRVGHEEWIEIARRLHARLDRR